MEPEANGNHSSKPDAVLAEQIRRVLIGHPAIGEPGLRVEIEGETVVLRGTVATFERCMRIGEILAALFGDWHVRNEIEVAEFPEHDRSERLP